MSWLGRSRGPVGPSCSRGHVLLVWEPAPCGAGHDHRVYCCPMLRRGRVCGEVVVVPAMSVACEKSSL